MDVHICVIIHSFAYFFRGSRWFIASNSYRLIDEFFLAADKSAGTIRSQNYQLNALWRIEQGVSPSNDCIVGLNRPLQVGIYRWVFKTVYRLYKGEWGLKNNV